VDLTTSIDEAFAVSPTVHRLQPKEAVLQPATQVLGIRLEAVHWL
jgi:hypothetical protein